MVFQFFHQVEHQKKTHSLWTHAVRLRLMGLGQARDIAEHQKRVSSCLQHNPQAHVVLYGISRGALTTFNAHAQHKYASVRALILEGCPDSIPNVVNTAFGSWTHWLYKKGVQYFCEHNPEGTSALNSVEQFPRNTPVLFITSEKDRTVPASCTIQLAIALAQTGHPHVYCLLLKNASHNGYAYEDPDDARMYQAVVHAFYKKYQINGYHEEYAQAGEKILEICHLT